MWLLLCAAASAADDPAPVTEGAPSDRCAALRTSHSAAVLSELEPSALARQTGPAWRAVATATCAWARALPLAGAGACDVTAYCATRSTEDRLAMLASPSPAARAADLLRTTGRWCPPEGDVGCAEIAREREEERLAAVVDAVARSDGGVRAAQRVWFAYRDAACDAEGLMAGDGLAWSRAACGAALAARRTELLADLVGAAADRELVERIGKERLSTAARDVRPRGRAWEDWLRLVTSALAPDDGADRVRGLVRELVEARADGAVFPPLVSTGAFERCAPPFVGEPYGDAACWLTLRTETEARRDGAVDRAAERYTRPAEAAEAAWRSDWCAGAPTEACASGIDWVVSVAAEALAAAGAPGGT